MTDRTAPTKTTWRVYARIEKGGQYAEYDDVATLYTPTVPTEKAVVAAQCVGILRACPHLRGGKITGHATRIN
ncbi:hypothetical protein [Streptomyces pakalii]|uniref:Uncharacterized protein n=1 Tax=Streptomyces pakalii TaxID=3036494 RepID=A0ABT7DCP9_9ACTN|nr:hypothetical protein [Streptomyces pakalii]MDJ1643590.1 hypothetical protein [Streptomyces pakalii]